VGPDVTGIKKGDIVVCGLHMGQDMVLEKNLMRCLGFGEIYGVLKDKDFANNLEEMVIKGSTTGENFIPPASPIIRPVS